MDSLPCPAYGTFWERVWWAGCPTNDSKASIKDVNLMLLPGRGSVLLRSDHVTAVPYK